MRKILRRVLINLTALYITTQIIPGIQITGGLRGWLVSVGMFILADMLLVPFLRILFLPLNLLTLGLFAWGVNVLALYFLVSVVPTFKLHAYHFYGANFGLLIIPQLDLTPFLVVVVASFLIGSIIHLLNWVSH